MFGSQHLIFRFISIAQGSSFSSNMVDFCAGENEIQYENHSQEKFKLPLRTYSIRDRRATLRLGGGGWEGTISDSILGGTEHFFLLILYNFKNIGGGHVPPPPPHSTVLEYSLKELVAGSSRGAYS